MTDEAERLLVEKEKKQMIALIGNIAHDLKTPLHSFLMDLESLKTNKGFISCKYCTNIYH